MTNRLSGENSPYLLQHAANPVDWYPWGDEALSKARAENKPIFLSIGYAACHWCHVMAHESFEDPDTAALMNRYFVNIKVDREERPDLDGIYINAVVAMTGSGGWPMSVFLAPDGTPFYGGTYFPPVRRYNRPSFREVLLTIARVWEQDQASLLESGEKIKQFLTHNTGPAEETLDFNLLDQCSRKLLETYDWKYGGWGQAPKFPQPMAIEFLLRQMANGNLDVGAAAWHALDSMAIGGMYDVVGGGFARYSTDERWLVPHFEKMLYDNAQLALVYLYGYMLSKDHRYRLVCEETLDFILRELATRLNDSTGTETGFFSSLDADSDGSEGSYYLWSVEEIEKLIPDTVDRLLFLEAYGITEAGNFEGKNVLQKVSTDDVLALKYNLTSEDVSFRLGEIRKRLLLAREQRNRPATDDKVITSWNALALLAFSEAARYLRREDYLVVARQNGHFLLNRLWIDGKLYRSWRNGRAMHRAYLEDYAALGLALLALYKADPANHRWYKAAVGLGDSILESFADPDWGFFDTHDEHEQLITRPKDFQDNATPSGNSLAGLLLLELSAYSWDKKWSAPVDGALLRIQKLVSQYPTGFAKWLCAFDTRFQSIQEVAILGDLQQRRTKLLLEVVSAQYRPRLALAVSPIPITAEAPDLLRNRTLLDNLPTAYVCHDMVCNQPVNSPENLIDQLNQTPQHS